MSVLKEFNLLFDSEPGYGSWTVLNYPLLTFDSSYEGLLFLNFTVDHVGVTTGDGTVTVGESFDGTGQLTLPDEVPIRGKVSFPEVKSTLEVSGDLSGTVDTSMEGEASGETAGAATGTIEWVVIPEFTGTFEGEATQEVTLEGQGSLEGKVEVKSGSFDRPSYDANVDLKMGVAQDAQNPFSFEGGMIGVNNFQFYMARDLTFIKGLYWYLVIYPIDVHFTPDWFDRLRVRSCGFVLSSGIIQNTKRFVKLAQRFRCQRHSQLALVFGYDNPSTESVRFFIPGVLSMEFISHKCVDREGTQPARRLGSPTRRIRTRRRCR
jgi:hypothetical protein